MTPQCLRKVSGKPVEEDRPRAAVGTFPYPHKTVAEMDELQAREARVRQFSRWMTGDAA